jgi:hypothetical protein
MLRLGKCIMSGLRSGKRCHPQKRTRTSISSSSKHFIINWKFQPFGVHILVAQQDQNLKEARTEITSADSSGK